MNSRNKRRDSPGIHRKKYSESSRVNENSRTPSWGKSPQRSADRKLNWRGEQAVSLEFIGNTSSRAWVRAGGGSSSGPTPGTPEKKGEPHLSVQGGGGSLRKDKGCHGARPAAREKKT